MLDMHLNSRTEENFSQYEEGVRSERRLCTKRCEVDDDDADVLFFVFALFGSCFFAVGLLLLPFFILAGVGFGVGLFRGIVSHGEVRKGWGVTPAVPLFQPASEVIFEKQGVLCIWVWLVKENVVSLK
ncbi:hypothetical protein SK128_022598 [Halocaridina rubra]|uniref:Transmembrane protein n=1 Tax=Halocaridina rubra TaxID=373956 RepID=A0AAN9AAA2_HALRR